MTLLHEVNIVDKYGWGVENTPMDEMMTITPVRLIGSTFVGTTIDTNFWTAAQTGTGAGSTQANGAITINSGTTTTSTASITSVRKARYIGGNSNRFRAVLQLGDTGHADNYRRWGMFDGTDGAYFKLDGTTLKIGTIKTGTPTEVASSSWNQSTTTPTLTNANTYEIYITNTKAYFSINGTLVHIATFLTDTWTDTLNLPVRIDSTNTAGSTGYTVIVRVATIYRLGELHTNPISAHITSATTTVCKYNAGMLHRIVVNNPTANAITVYDNTSATGTVLAIITPQANSSPFSLEYGVPFSNGLTIVTAGTPDLTIVYE